MPDVFDTLLINTCDILEKERFDGGNVDDYGQPSQSFRTKLTAWPCRQSTKKGGVEYKQGKESAKNTFNIYMRPPTQDDSALPFTLDTHHWLRIGTDYFNIQGVNDPSRKGHHLEVQVEQVLP